MFEQLTNKELFQGLKTAINKLDADVPLSKCPKDLEQGLLKICNEGRDPPAKTLTAIYPGDYSVSALIVMLDLGLGTVAERSGEDKLDKAKKADLFRIVDNQIMLPKENETYKKTSTYKFMLAVQKVCKLEAIVSEHEYAPSSNEGPVMGKLLLLLLGKSFQLTGIPKTDSALKQFWYSCHIGKPDFKLVGLVAFESTHIKNLRAAIKLAFSKIPPILQKVVQNLVGKEQNQSLLQYLIKKESLYKEVPAKKIFYAFSRTEKEKFPEVKIFEEIDKWKKAQKNHLFDAKEKDGVVAKLKKVKEAYDSLPKSFRDIVFKRIKLLERERGVKIKGTNVTIDVALYRATPDVSSLALDVVMLPGLSEEDRRVILSGVGQNAILMASAVSKESKKILEKSSLPIVGEIKEKAGEFKPVSVDFKALKKALE